MPIKPVPQRLRALTCVVFCLVLVADCSTGNASSSAGDVAQSDDELGRALASNSTLRTAARLIEDGHPWKATLAVAPLLKKSPNDRAAILIGARAAAGWDGWLEVERLLAMQPWLDSSFNGEGHELLARAALASNAPDTAAVHSAAAIRAADVALTKAVRQVYLARALDRGDHPDSAGAMYAAAAKGLPEISDWLALRAAGADRDSEARARDYVMVRAAVAKARVPWTEAQARERFGDLAGAADRFAALGAHLSSLRLRLGLATDSASVQKVKDSLISFLRRQPSRDDARQAVEALDRVESSLSPRDELEIGRALSGIGPLARALSAFERASRAGILRPEDRLQYALVLSRSGRARDALAQLDSIQPSSSVAGQAAYQRARMIMTSSGNAVAMPMLRAIASRFSGDTGTASSALYLLADLSIDEGNDDLAVSIYHELYQKYPSSDRANDARFRAAILNFAHGRSRVAALAFDSIVNRFGGSSERTAARYWSGRAWKAAGDARKAWGSWQAALADQPTSYYGQASARRLKRAAWSPANGPDKFIAAPAVDSAFARIALLERLGMDAEVRFELDALEDRAGSSRELALATANAFRAHGETPRAIRIANKLLDQGARDVRVYRLAFPMVDRDELTRQSAAQHLDPALVAGLIRQESSFDPHALSVANARGLMQVLPAVGAEISRALHFPVWSPSLLYDSDANIQIGTAHLAAATKQYGDVTRILAAYNAGDTRVARWSKRVGSDDPELFTEEIPFVETRDYVRAVQRNAEMYEILYRIK